MQAGKRSKEYTRFAEALSKVLKVSHAELADKIKSTKRPRKQALGETVK
jgi:hypothetical protein